MEYEVAPHQILVGPVKWIKLDGDELLKIADIQRVEVVGSTISFRTAEDGPIYSRVWNTPQEFAEIMRALDLGNAV